MKFLLMVLGLGWLGFTAYNANYHLQLDYIALLLPCSYLVVVVLLLRN